tara:strand:+ start:661 stop:852 length:192 start_codon:yes stop_codon:yes gene_type:complete
MSKIGRNNPCPCGSGKKFKKCHLIIEDQIATEQNIIDTKWLEEDFKLGEQRIREYEDEHMSRV